MNINLRNLFFNGLLAAQYHAQIVGSFGPLGLLTGLFPPVPLRPADRLGSSVARGVIPLISAHGESCRFRRQVHACCYPRRSAVGPFFRGWLDGLSAAVYQARTNSRGSSLLPGSGSPHSALSPAPCESFWREHLSLVLRRRRFWHRETLTTSAGAPAPTFLPGAVKPRISQTCFCPRPVLLA